MMQRYTPRASSDNDERTCPRGHYMAKIGPNTFECFHCKTPVRYDTWGDRIEEERSQPERRPTEREEDDGPEGAPDSNLVVAERSGEPAAHQDRGRSVAGPGTARQGVGAEAVPVAPLPAPDGGECRELDYPVDGEWMCITHARPIIECQRLACADKAPACVSCGASHGDSHFKNCDRAAPSPYHTLEQAIEEAEKRPPNKALKDLLRSPDHAPTPQARRHWLDPVSNAKSWCLRYDAMNSPPVIAIAADGVIRDLLAHIERLSAERDALERVNETLLADEKLAQAHIDLREAQARIAELSAERDDLFAEAYCKGAREAAAAKIDELKEAQASIARLEGALREIVSADPEKPNNYKLTRFQCEQVARAALKEQG